MFGTIAAESQRMINETYSSFVQGFMPQLARPDVDSLEGLTTAIIVDQERMGRSEERRVGKEGRGRRARGEGKAREGGAAGAAAGDSGWEAACNVVHHAGR